MKPNHTKWQRNGFQVMFGLIGMVKPLAPIMMIAILMGCIGNLMAIFITILGGMGIADLLGYYNVISLKTIFILMAVFAVLRGILRYAEQASNHYIAFKLLARIRHKVFAALRKLAPAKLDGKEKGNLISIITSDIELLEVFYAHTISPIAIAVITSLVMVLFLGKINVLFGVLAGVFYILVGFVIPVLNSHFGQKTGQEYRRKYGELNTIVLDNLYGMDEIKQFQGEQTRQNKMEHDTEELEQLNAQLKKGEALQRIITDSVILASGIIICVTAGFFTLSGKITVGEAIVAAIAMMSSFGPVAALSALSNNLNQTLASGNRVLDLLKEEPVVEDILSGKEAGKGDIQLENVSFSYPDATDMDPVLKDFSLTVKENTIHGILGKSGCGKSTLLKLMMRFNKADNGTIYFGNNKVNEITTTSLRNHISYVTQETFLFRDTIENNIKVAKEDATREEVVEAAKKASIHELIESLPNGYDTVLAELGESLSGGERQRIGIARAFLHDAPIILLDEPTSNIDSLNEGIILRSLLNEKENKTIVLVSHRKSTMAIADDIYSFSD